MALFLVVIGPSACDPALELLDSDALRPDASAPAGAGEAPISTPPGIEIERRAFARPGPEVEAPFTRVPAHELGLERPVDWSIDDFFPPFWNGRGLAAGDIDGDGLTDLALATETGPRLYRNIGGRFEALPIPDDVGELNCIVVALVDLVGDDGLDLFLGAWRDGNWLMENTGGRFAKAVELPDTGAVQTAAAAFGDLDNDGDLDAVLGNWFSGFNTRVPPASSRNHVLVNEGDGGFSLERLPGLPGETLSVLVSDLNADGHLDVIIGNDFKQPDVHYLGRRGLELERVTRRDDLFPVSTFSTMSIDSADIDNDLSLDVYEVQIARGKRGRDVHYETRTIDQYCDDIDHVAHRARCEEMAAARDEMNFRGRAMRDLRRCRKLPEHLEEACRDHAYMRASINVRSVRWCLQTGRTTRERLLCRQHLKNRPIRTSWRQRRKYVRQRMSHNVLLQRFRGRYVERAEELGVAVTDWGWNGKFADLNNDGWQDLYVANGTWMEVMRLPPNLYFENREGRYFEDRTDDTPLGDHLIVTAYVYLDLEGDGDLDIITNALGGPLRAYVNHQQGNAVQLALRDHVGNSHGVGARVTIGYGPGGERRQLREIKASGGFLSYDAPVAHFGLGRFEEVATVDVAWPTGPPTHIEGPLPAGHRYVIERMTEGGAGSPAEPEAG